MSGHGKPMRRPNQRDLNDSRSFGKFYSDQTFNTTGGRPPRTTASAYGTPQYATTSFNLSDILQGTFVLNDSSDNLLLINKALTQDLDGLYAMGADGLTSFSTAAPSPALSSGGQVGSGIGGGAVGGINAGSTIEGALVSRDWVTSLPTTHPTSGALIWTRQGKGSREMHVPTDADLKKDIAQHKQYADMPPEWKHPWNMDRVGGGIGGGAKIYYDVDDADTILGEDPNAGGQVSGAFGALSPEHEQFYCSMAWPYKSTVDGFNKAKRPDVAAIAANLTSSDYKGKKILVYSTKTQLACVCTPGDWGPHPYYSNGVEDKPSIYGSYIGLSPDVHWALGTDHGSEFILGWVDDATPVGPYNPTVDQAVPGTGNLSGGGGTTPATGGKMVNSIDEIRAAGKKIVDHPNNWLSKHSGFKTLLLDGTLSNPYPEEVMYKGADGRQFLKPSLLNYLWYILEGGFILDGYLGAIGHKQKLGNTSKLSNHASGGAIDIGSIGLAKAGRVYSFADTTNGRSIADQLFWYLSTLPKDTRPEEVGCSFAFTYGDFRVYKDPNTTHIHLGFNNEQGGSLISALKA